VADLGPAITDFHDLFKKHGYDDAVIFGHALAGNLHFVMLQDFNCAKEVARYQSFMDELVKIVVHKYKGSLKAEHGTGRNMAPFVKVEWGDEVYGIMEEIKNLLDPGHLMNPGVILNKNPLAHVQDLKTFPLVDPAVDTCIECGFCERYCVSHQLTLSARQRIVILRVIKQLEQNGNDPEILKSLKENKNYFLMDTCAADGLCSHACPSGINTGEYVKKLRQNRKGAVKKNTGKFIGQHIQFFTALGRSALCTGNLVKGMADDETLIQVSNKLRDLTNKNFPKWFSHMPTSAKRKTPPPYVRHLTKNHDQVVYFPSCINRTLGVDSKTPEDKGLNHVIHELCEKAGIKVIYPEHLERLCCGLAFASKGLKQAARERANVLKRALSNASKGGKLPILCDMSPCLFHMKETLPNELNLLEPVDFTLKHLVPNLKIQKLKTTVVIHPVCSLKKMGLENKIKSLARICAEKIVTTRTNCCGFAGDKGFWTPELNCHGLKGIKDQIPPGVNRGYSTSRTCEIGLAEASGIPFKSILYLVNNCAFKK